MGVNGLERERERLWVKHVERERDIKVYRFKGQILDLWFRVRVLDRERQTEGLGVKVPERERERLGVKYLERE